MVQEGALTALASAADSSQVQRENSIEGFLVNIIANSCQTY